MTSQAPKNLATGSLYSPSRFKHISPKLDPKAYDPP